MQHIAHLPLVARFATPAFLGYVPGWLGDWIAAFGAAIAVCFALTDRRTKAVLNHNLVLWTGRASYSLYLVHATVLFALAYTLIGTRYVYLLAPLYFVLTIVATAAFYRVVEVPTMNLGRELARRMRQHRPVPQEAPAQTTVAN